MNEPSGTVLNVIERRAQMLQQETAKLKAIAGHFEAIQGILSELPEESAKEIRQFLGFRELVSVELKKGDPDSSEFQGMSALECAARLLIESGQPLHFSALAKAAFKRGYRGRLSDGDAGEVETRTINSFWAALSRSEDFKSTGKGFYDLVERVKVIDDDPLTVDDISKINDALQEAQTPAVSNRELVFREIKRWADAETIVKNTGLSKKQISGVLNAPDIKMQVLRRENSKGFAEYLDKETTEGMLLNQLDSSS